MLVVFSCLSYEISYLKFFLSPFSVEIDIRMLQLQSYYLFFTLFLFYSYFILLYTLVHRECTRGQQIKLQESRKSIKEGNDWFCMATNQSNKVLKKNNLRSSMNLSISSKHLLFLSLQRHHFKQWGTINKIKPFQ